MVNYSTSFVHYTKIEHIHTKNRAGHNPSQNFLTGSRLINCDALGLPESLFRTVTHLDRTMTKFLICFLFILHFENPTISISKSTLPVS